MRKLLCIALIFMMMLAMVGVSTAEAKRVLKAADVTDKSGNIALSDVIRGYERKSYFGFSGVDLSGVQSVTVNAYNRLEGGTNGETFLLVLDNPTSGKVIGSVVLTDVGDDITVSAAITPTSGVHTLYFYDLYGKGSFNMSQIKSITLSDETVEDTRSASKVPDSVMVDTFSDTWVATDDMGRAVADFEEVGEVKKDGRTLGMLYWNWHTDKARNRNAVVISDIVKAHPEAKEDYTNPVWDTMGKYYWSEPLLGFYDSFDYWVYKKHAEMLSNAGVDAIFFDYSNGGYDYIITLNVLAEAYRDAKAKGLRVPKISAMMSLGGNYNDSFRGLTSIYYNCFVKNDYSDIWFYWDGKPLLYGNSNYTNASKDIDTNNSIELPILQTIADFFTYRAQGRRNGSSDGWMWLENFPQVLRMPDETGRPEFMSVGVGINQSTIYGLSQTGVFSDPYNKGRGYSEAFGEDYTENGKRLAWFFREQAALALQAEPKFVMIDGWNEFTAIRQNVYNGFPNSFVDLYDDENSRDFEPSAGVLKDDYYNLLVDFVRKYKGVRPAPTAGEAKTIDINGSLAQWDTVVPEFINAYQDYTRDADGLGNGATGQPWHYTTQINNAITGAKVSYDADNLYFMAKTASEIKTGTPHWMHLYLNTDRNHATGWEGYDFAVNLNGVGTLSASDGTSWTTIGNVSYNVTGNMLQLAIPRALIGETDTIDLEFKWTDAVDGSDILNFYKDGSSAPLGRFNYLYTQKEQTALASNERSALKATGTSVLKALSNRMVANGGKMYVYEADIRLTPFEANGTLYIPEETFDEIMGYGHAKTSYNYFYNMFRTYHYDMNDDLTEMVNFTWTYSVIGESMVHVNGAVKYLSAPVIVRDGRIYIPLSFIEECYGLKVQALDDGVYVVSQEEADASLINKAISHLN